MQLRQFHGNCTWFFSHIFSEMLHWLMMEVLFSEEIETIIYLNNQFFFRPLAFFTWKYISRINNRQYWPYIGRWSLKCVGRTCFGSHFFPCYYVYCWYFETVGNHCWWTCQNWAIIWQKWTNISHRYSTFHQNSRTYVVGHFEIINIVFCFPYNWKGKQNSISLITD